MAESLLARFPGERGEAEWAIIRGSDEPSAIRRGSLGELARDARDKSVEFLLPAGDVLLFDIQLPVKSDRRLKQALPYAVEELLADDVENYHLAWKKISGGNVAVAAIAQETLNERLRVLFEAGIEPAGVYAETLFLPAMEGFCSILIEEGRAAVRYRQWRGGGIEAGNLPVLLEKITLEYGSTPQYRVWHDDTVSGLSFDQADCELVESGLAVFKAHRPDKNRRIDLLAGSYERKRASGLDIKAWLPAAAIVVVAVLIQFSTALNRLWEVRDRNAALEGEITALFRQTFPDVKRIVNVKIQSEQELAELRKTAAGGPSEFMNLLYRSGEIIGQDGSLRIREIDFKEGMLRLRINGTGIGQIELLKQRIESTQNLAVTIKSAETGEAGVNAQIEVGDKNS